MILDAAKSHVVNTLWAELVLNESLIMIQEPGQQQQDHPLVISLDDATAKKYTTLPISVIFFLSIVKYSYQYY